ncbi:unnamed protein product [Rotaria magnacalcarata]|uniref:Uncharacterized protein n=1 Tax=Rotaria magnacalcarata TaxID=392030 RepID=A0A816LPB6_9BILA|nr:unnamed protein product [Rotaria magnacalcarata]
MINSSKNRFSPTRMFQTKPGSESPLSHLALTSPPPIKHWYQTCHETILASNGNNHSIQLNLAGGADNGQFVYFNELISLLKNNQTSFIILKGGKIDIDEIILEIDQHKVAGCTLADVKLVIETLSINGKQIKLQTVKSGLTKDLRQFLDARFQKGSIDHDLQQTIRDNLYMRTVPCTTRPPRPGEINGQDYTFLSTKDFRTLEKSGNLLESGVYKGNHLDYFVFRIGHYYGTPRPPKEPLLTNGQHQYLSSTNNNNHLRRSNSANEMFQQQRTADNGSETNGGMHYQYPNNDPEFFVGHSPNEQMFHQSNGEHQASLTTRSMMNENSLPTAPHLSGELISCSLQKSQTGFGFTIIGGNEKGEHFLQIKDILPDGPAARDGKLRRGDILVYVNDTNVLGFSHTDVVRIFQSLSINDIIRLTVCRGYPLVVNFDDPQIDVVSLNGVHNSLSVNSLPNGGYTEYQPNSHLNNSTRLYTIKIRKGDSGFGFTVADSPLGQRVKAIVDKQRCQDLCENDLLLSINGQDLIGKQHTEVVDILVKCSKDMETTFVIRRGDPDVNNNNNNNNNNINTNNNNNNNNNNQFLLNGTNRFDKYNQENDQIDTRYASSKLNEKPRSKTPTPFGSTPLADTLPLRSRTPLPTSSTTLNSHQRSHPTSIDNNNPYDNNLSFLAPNSVDTSTPIIETELSPNSMNNFNRQTAWSRSARDIRTTTTTTTSTTNGNAPILRSKTPGPEFGTTITSSYRANTLMGMKQRSKTPTANDFSSNGLHNSRSLQSVHPQYFELVVNLTILRPNDGFGLRIVGGEEEKSQVSVGRIVPNSPAYIDGRLRKGDEIIKIDGHSTIRASHERVVQLMQQAKDNQRVSLIVRRYLYPNNNELPNQYNRTDFDSYVPNDFRTNSINDNGIRHVTLQKLNDNQSFGFVIISSQNKAGATVGKIIPNSPADQCGQLHVNDRILAVNGVDLTHMLHTDVVNLIKDSGRTITLKIGPPIHFDDRSQEISNPFSTMSNNNLSNGIRPSSSSPMVIANGNHHPLPNNGYHSMNTEHHSIRNAFSHNPLNILERNQNRPPSRANGVLKSSSSSADDYFTVDLQRPYPTSSFGFSIRGGREFSIPLFILKLAENGPASRDGRMKSGDQIIEINGRSTYGMTHNEAISLIRDGGLYARLLIRKTNAPPPSLDELKIPMAPVGNGIDYYNPGQSSHWQPSGYT